MEVHITHDNGTAICYGVAYVTDDHDDPSDKRVTFTGNGSDERVFSDATITSTVRVETKKMNPLVVDIYSDVACDDIDVYLALADEPRLKDAVDGARESGDMDPAAFDEAVEYVNGAPQHADPV